MREIIPVLLVDDLGCCISHSLEILKNNLLACTCLICSLSSVIAQCVGRDDLIHAVFPPTVIDHQMAISLRSHVVKDIIRNFGMILRFCLDCENIISLIIDLREEFLLFLCRIKIIRQELKRCRNNNLVIYFDFVIHSHEYFSVMALYRCDIGIQSCLVAKLVIQAFPDILCTLFPCPEIDLDEIHGRLEIKVFQDICRRDFIKISVAEGSERSDPDILNEFNTVEFTELFERESQILQIRVLAGDFLTIRRYGISVIAAFRYAAVSVNIISFVLCLKEFAEHLQLLSHLEQARNLERVFLRLERLDNFTLQILIITIQFRSVVCNTAELFHIVNGIIRRYSHDCSHLISSAVVVR